MRFLKVLAIFVAVPLATLFVFYAFFGLRVEFTGAGRPRLAFGTDLDEQAEIVARHRAAQRAAAASSETSADADAVAFEPEAPPDVAAAAPPPPATGTATAGVAAAAPAATAPKPAAYWTDFRGPRRDGIYRERALLTNWPTAGLEPLWKQPSGAGYASFVVANGRAFTIEQRGREEAVAAYDVPSGRELWTHGWPALFSEAMGGDGPRATPTWSDGIVYALGATGELRALDEATGQSIWQTNILDDADAGNLPWGMAGAPLVTGNAVIVAPGGSNGRSIVAYDRRTGAELWASGGERAGYASPVLATLNGREQVLVFTGVGLVSVTPDRGERLWFYPWNTNADINAAQPLVVGDNRVFLSSGYNVGAAVIEIVPDGAGYTVREAWRNNRMKNRFSSSVLYEGHIYGLDEAILGCVDVATGDLKWKGGRYGYGQLLLAGDRLIVLTERGEVVVVAASPDGHQELARFQAIEGKTWNVPAIADGILLVRNLREMAAFDLRQR